MYREHFVFRSCSRYDGMLPLRYGVESLELTKRLVFIYFQL
jgi:hypothetical protein